MFLTAMLMCAINMTAQLTSVSGTVLSAEDDEPIIGASVRVKGHTHGAVTDADGHFVLKGLTAADKEIEISFVGCQTQYLPVADNMVVRLVPKAESMDEVIVVAFGKQKRESFTGSASVVGAAQIEKQQVNTPLDVLKGHVTGVQMTDGTGVLGEPSMLVRGISSINAGTSPLIVVDGLPYNGYYNDINTADVANITVLKDAASCALYGARGANGVILITTKQAERGNTRVTFDAKWGQNSDGRVRYNTIDDPGQYYEAAYLGYYNYYLNRMGQTKSGAHVSANNMLGRPYTEGGLGYMVYTVPAGQFLIGENGRLNPQAALGNRIAHNGNFYTLVPDNWRKVGTRNGLRQEYNVSLSGGNEKFRFLASLGYLDNEGISYGSDMSRYSARLKTEYQAYSWLRIGANAGYNHQKSNNQGGVFGIVYQIAPIYPAYMRDGDGNIIKDIHGKRFDYGNGDDMGVIRPQDMNGNTLQDDRLNISGNVSHSFNISGYATADFLKYFSLTVNGNVYLTENRIKYGLNPYYGYDKERGGFVSTSMYKTADTNWQQLLNYNQTIGHHNISAMLGHEYSRTSQDHVYADRTNVAMFGENTELNGAIVKGDNEGYTTLYNVEGFFMRAQYDYDSRYFLSASYRRDGSSRFAPGHRWGNFWSAGAAWIINREEWFPKTTWVNMLKVKLSYGEQGNDAIGNYRYTDTYNIRNSNDQVAYVFNSKGNPDITWETVGSLNAGFEFELFNSRLRGGLEYYNRTTRDMLMYFSVPYINGYSGYYSNVGDMNNHGLEFNITGDILAGRNFSWTVDFNLTWQRNKVSSLPASSKTLQVDGVDGFADGEFFVGEGRPMNTWYIKSYAGVSDRGEAMYWKTDAATGQRQATTSYSEADYYLCGSAQPDVFGGFGTSFRVYDFDLSVSCAYSIGGLMYDSGYQSLMTPSYSTYAIGNAWHKDVFKGWTAENPSATIPRWQYGDTYTAAFSDRFLTDASYLTLSNVTVGYTLPKNLTQKFYVSRLRVFFSGENLGYITKRKGFDPRGSFTYGSYGAYSPMRNLTGGLQIQF